jgi:hypothetical protein
MSFTLPLYFHSPTHWLGAALPSTEKQLFHEIKKEIFQLFPPSTENTRRITYLIVYKFIKTNILGFERSMPILRQLIKLLRHLLLDLPNPVSYLKVIQLIDLLIRKAGYRAHMLIGRKRFLQTVSLTARRWQDDGFPLSLQVSAFSFNCILTWYLAFKGLYIRYPFYTQTYLKLKNKYKIQFTKGENDPTRMLIKDLKEVNPDIDLSFHVALSGGSNRVGTTVGSRGKEVAVTVQEEQEEEEERVEEAAEAGEGEREEIFLSQSLESDPHHYNDAHVSYDVYEEYDNNSFFGSPDAVDEEAEGEEGEPEQTGSEGGVIETIVSVDSEEGHMILLAEDQQQKQQQKQQKQQQQQQQQRQQRYQKYEDDVAEDSLSMPELPLFHYSQPSSVKKSVSIDETPQYYTPSLAVKGRNGGTDDTYEMAEREEKKERRENDIAKQREKEKREKQIKVEVDEVMRRKQLELEMERLEKESEEREKQEREKRETAEKVKREAAIREQQEKEEREAIQRAAALASGVGMEEEEEEEHGTSREDSSISSNDEGPDLGRDCGLEFGRRKQTTTAAKKSKKLLKKNSSQIIFEELEQNKAYDNDNHSLLCISSDSNLLAASRDSIKVHLHLSNPHLVSDRSQNFGSLLSKFGSTSGYQQGTSSQNHHSSSQLSLISNDEEVSRTSFSTTNSSSKKFRKLGSSGNGSDGNSGNSQTGNEKDSKFEIKFFGNQRVVIAKRESSVIKNYV